MARRFSLNPDEYHARSIAEYRREWGNIPDAEACNVIAVENQYLDFHRFLLASIRHQAPTGSDPIQLGLSLRAGALKAATLICASIAEAALRAHAESRGYGLPKNSWQRTFGKVLEAWLDPEGNPHADVAPIWPALQRLRLGRNNVHLYRAIEDGSNFYDILEAEEMSLKEAEAVLAHLRTIK